MIHVRRFLWSLACAAALLPAVPRADNPIVQTIYTADPAPMVHDGRLYLYTGHDEDGSTYFTMKDWRVFSTADMVNWTDHGSPLSLKTFSWAASDAWAGQCIQRNGKFYWYVPVRNAGGGNQIGVAVSSSPTGPFTDPLGRPLVASSQIDPTVFVDDDGQAYLYYANPDLYYVKLNADMISYSGSPVKVPLTTQGFGVRSKNDRPTQFEEGPWLYKRSGLYYMVFAAGPISEHISYSTGPTATGPWTFRGVVMPTQGGSFTNHPGVADFKGNSYFFYHNGALPGGGGFTRSVAVERFTYGADGSIPTINMTSSGPPAVATLDPFARVEAETIAWESGVETEDCSEGGRDVGSIQNGAYVKVKNVAFGAGATSFDARVASGTSGGTIELHLDSLTGPLVGTCSVAGTGGWQTWTTRSCAVTGATGTHDLFLKFTGGSGYLFNVNWWKFTAVGGTTYALDVTRGGTGSGTVTSSTGGIDCGATCSATYASGASVTLTATAAAGSTFAGFGGDCTGTTCVLSMTAPHVVTATFTAVQQQGGPISINAGGSASGTFVADVDFSGGSTYSTTAAVDTSRVPSPVPPQAVFQTERYGEFTYTVPGLTAGAAHSVTLYFAETYWTAAGQRTFDVAINGATVLSAFDIFAAAGGANKAVARTFDTTANGSGQVVIAFTRGGGPDNPKVVGITVAAGGSCSSSPSCGSSSSSSSSSSGGSSSSSSSSSGGSSSSSSSSSSSGGSSSSSSSSGGSSSGGGACKAVSGGQSGNFGSTDAACFTVTGTVNGWGCSNADGRTVTVNGTATTCGKLPLPGSSPYTFSFGAGSYPWASFYWW